MTKKPQSESPSLDEVIAKRVSRRNFLKSGILLGSAASLGAGGYFLAKNSNNKPANTQNLKTTTALSGNKEISFTPISYNNSTTHTIADGYDVQPLISWGDAITKPSTNGQSNFSAIDITAQQQNHAFGYNNDFLAYMPLGENNSSSDHGLLCVNHEYPTSALMFADLPHDYKLSDFTKEQVDVEIAALGVSVIEVKKDSINKNRNTTTEAKWNVVKDSKYNRRITAKTPIEISGPAAGHKRMQTSADPGGKLVLGSFGNCAGGKTPWGTVLTAEENINFYFRGFDEFNKKFTDEKGNKHIEHENHTRMGAGLNERNAWGRFYDRFDISKEPNEPNRFGWIVEYDPYDPTKPPVKRTALGRCKHECATTTLTPDGRVVVYSGDDEEFEYVYRFISRDKYNPNDKDANWGLLDNGTLYVARFNEDGNADWLELTHGKSGLTAENGFNSQADIMIELRRAADMLGATPMDRPEDVEVNPKTGQLFISLTKNKSPYNPRLNRAKQKHPANPHTPNIYGHILELSPPKDADGNTDHSADRFGWGIFLNGDDPQNDKDSITANNNNNGNKLSNPDNFAFDNHGRIWICTDGQESAIGVNDGLYVSQTAGDKKAQPQLFFTSPVGAEITGPEFTPDGKTLFLSIQHPGEGYKKSSYHRPSTRWPNFEEGKPPLPTVITITKKDGGEIG